MSDDATPRLAAGLGDLSGWDMFLGFTLANVAWVMAEQARTFLADPRGDDPDAIAVDVRDGAGGLTCTLGRPRLSAFPDTLTGRMEDVGPRLTLPLADVRLDGRAVAPGAVALDLTFRLDLQIETPTWHELLEHPVVQDEVKLALRGLLASGEVTTADHGLAVLRPRFTTLDLGAALCPDVARLAALGDDRPRVLALLERWLRDLGPARNPFFLGCLVLSRRVEPGPALQLEPTLASVAFLLSMERSHTDSQIAFLINCHHRPAPTGHVPGEVAVIRFAAPDPGSHQGTLGFLPELVVRQQLAPKARRLLGLGAGPPDELSTSRLLEHHHRILESSPTMSLCLRVTERVAVALSARSGQDAVLGRYGEIAAVVTYQRDSLERWYPGTVGPDEEDVRDAATQRLHGALTATSTCRFTIVDRELRLDHRFEAVTQVSPETRAILQARLAQHRGQPLAQLYRDADEAFARKLVSHDVDLRALATIRIDLLADRCVLPGRNQYSFRDPQATRVASFDHPFGLYFSLTRNV